MRLKASPSVLALIFVLFCVFQCESAAGYKTEVEITPAPPEEETTKKSGFFSGIKSFFRSSPTTTTTALPPVLTSIRTPVAAGGTPHPNPLAPQSGGGAASAGGAQKPPPLAIPHAPLQPLGPRPDTPPSSPLAGNSQQPPHWPQPQVGQSQSPSTAGARPQFGLQQSNAQSPQMSAVANGGVATSAGGSNSGGVGAGGSNFGAGGSNFGAGGSNFGAGSGGFGAGSGGFGAAGRPGAAQPNLPSGAGAVGSNFGAGGSNFGAGSGGFGAAGRPGAAQPSLPSGFAPYHPPKAQPSGFDLSYGGGGAAGGHSPSGRPGFGLAPLTSTTTTTPKSVQPPSPTNFDMRGTFGVPIIGSGSTTTTTTRRPETPKEEFPSLPAPRRPSTGAKEDFPPLPTPRSPNPTPASPLRPSSPGIAQPSSPFVWGSSTPATSTTSSTPTLPGAGAGSPGVSFVPHSPSVQRTTTARPGAGTQSGGSGNSVATDDEIRALTETLYSKEQSVLNMMTVNPQGKTRSIDSTDAAPQPLLEVDPKALEVQTVAKMRLLFNNYEDDTLTNEYVTPNERKEENDFLDAVMSTQVMRQAMLFLQNKGIVSPDPKTHRDLVKELWFTQYSRGSGKIGSSGFEHVFVHEVKNGTLIGLHNWVYWGEEEKAGNLDYKGYLNQLDIGNKAKVLKVRFTHRGVNKPVNGLFIGTTPELELALYTVCFQLRPDRSCHVSLGNSQFDIVTYTWRYRGKHLIGSAFPEI